MEQTKKIKFFCLPGGGTSSIVFIKWGGLLSKHLRQCLIDIPGRGLRKKEQTLTDIESITEDLYRGWEKYMHDGRDEDYMLFGYCMGGIFLYELYKKIRREGKKLPVHIVLSAADVPDGDVYAEPFLENQATKYQFYDLLRSCFPEHTFPDTEMLTAFRHKFVDVLYAKYARDGRFTPVTVDELHAANCDDAMMESFEFRECLGLANDLMEILTVDTQICSDYQRSKPEVVKFNCGITCIAGKDDLLLKPERMRAWQRYTDKACTLDILEADHRFLMTANPVPCGVINRDADKIWETMQ